MNTAFADTFLFLAMLNERDAAHHAALAAAAAYSGSIVTTQWVLTEVGDAMSDPNDRTAFVCFHKELEQDGKFQIIPASDELFHRGVDFFSRRPDKSWSLTDCISFVVMQDIELSDALTGDQHFRQAGFTTLL